MRIADPPENERKEAEQLFEEFLDQYAEEEDIPDGAYDTYLREHGSRALVAYLDEIEMARKEATREGLI